MIRKTNTASGSYLLRRAAKLAKSIVSRFGIKHEFFDGFIVRGRRMGKNYSAEVYDPPAWLLVVGTLSAAPPTDIADSPVVEVPQGRDVLVGKLVATVSIPDDRLLTTRAQSGFTIGGSVPQISHPTLTGETASRVPGAGTLRSFSRLHAAQAFPVTPAAFVDRSAVVRYSCLLLAPNLYRSSFIFEDGQWTRRDTPASESALAAVSLIISDAFLRERGALPFCMRQNPPPYDPNSAFAAAFAQSQAPWHEAVAERYTSEDGVDLFRVVLWGQAVFDMINDSDMHGAKGFWSATFEVDIGARTGRMINTFLIDPLLEPEAFKRPRRLDNSYLYNAHLRAGGVLLGSGTAVIVDTFQVVTDGGSDPTSIGNTGRYLTLDMHWIDRSGGLVRTQTIQGAFPINTGPHDMCCPIGIATDGERAVGIVFSTYYLNRPSNIDVVVAGEQIATIALSTDVPFRQCLAASSAASQSAGQTDNQHWASPGAGGNQVCYIGNGKYLFYVSSVVGTGTIAAGDWAAAVYDSVENTVRLVGVIDPEIVTVFSSQLLGRPECVVPEGEGTLATILATRGNTAQRSNTPGVALGSTWISKDSGATWQKLMDYGSPSAVVYAGNLIQPRA